MRWNFGKPRRRKSQKVRRLLQLQVAGLVLVGSLCLIAWERFASSSAADLRRLAIADLDESDDLFTQEQREHGAALLHTIALFYSFLALAIVCDEFFVPALEVITEVLQLSPDVAGATFMAAGGSAPEFFTSLIGVIQETDVGIGTIVGSAVFNVLFVIGACALVAPSALQLTWFPLARDCSFYIVDLIALFLVIRDGAVQWWEALILFILYLIYVVFMRHSERIEAWSKAKLNPTKHSSEGSDHWATSRDTSGRQHSKDSSSSKRTGGSRNVVDVAYSKDFVSEQETPVQTPVPTSTSLPKVNMLDLSMEARSSHNSRTSAGGGGGPGSGGPTPSSSFRHKSRRNLSLKASDVGHLTKAMDEARSKSHQPVGVGLEPLPTVMSGGSGDETPAPVTPAKFATAPPGSASLLVGWCSVPTDMALEENENEEDGSPRISRPMPEQEEVTEIRPPSNPVKSPSQFGSNDGSGCGSVPLSHSSEPKCFGIIPDSNGSAALVDQPTPPPPPEHRKESHGTSGNQVPTRSGGYSSGAASRTGTFLGIEEEKEDDDDEQQPLDIWPPPPGSSRQDWLWYILALPIVVCLVCTIPDVRRDGFKRLFALSFFLAIVWIAFFTYWMVWFATVIARTAGMSVDVMGLTVLAVGTSVPDLLTSVIVAREGQGDMAISSSIGSNIFDVTVGLPVPWLLLTLSRTKNVSVDGSRRLSIGLMMLVGMVGFSIATVFANRWLMTRAMGLAMLTAYLVFEVTYVLISTTLTEADLPDF